MSTTERPRTREAFLALPEGGGFGTTERLIDGVLRTIPVMPATVAIYHSETDIISCVDDNGVRWSIGRYADGRWFKRRNYVTD